MKRIAFFLNLEPQPPTVTHQEKKFGGVTKKGTPIYYEPSELADARALFTARLKKFAPKKPWSCPIQLCTLWKFRIPEGRSAKVKCEWRTSKPDTENLQKLLKDVMTKCGFWKDDAFVCREIIEKKNFSGSEKHGILISITDLSNPQGENS